MKFLQLILLIFEIGNGYVGCEIVKRALKLGYSVVSINRTGKPDNSFLKAMHLGEHHDEQLVWRVGDIFKEDGWKNDLKDCDGVVSCVGAFGTNEVKHFCFG